MSSKVIPITSQAHFKSTLAATNYLVVDFYADWCGPCKQISPIFEQLAGQESKPGRIQFCKVNVDNQKDVAGTYGISAMPTFLVLKGTSVIETVRGANPQALRTAILSAAALAAKGSVKASPLFSGKGQTLGASSSGGGGNTGSRPVPAPSVDFAGLVSSPAAFAQGRGLLHTLVRFLGLYFSTLFSLEPMKTAEESPFAIKKAAGQKLR